jgi:molybdopterin adenylyltransferase
MGKKKSKDKKSKKLKKQKRDRIIEAVSDAAPAIEAAETADDLSDALKTAPQIPDLLAAASAHDQADQGSHARHGHDHGHDRADGHDGKHAHDKVHGHDGEHARHHDEGHAHHHDESDAKLTLALVTCSDTRSMKEDTAGAALESLIAERGWTCAEHVVVKDDRSTIAASIARLADLPEVDVVLTCGGSGLSLRDVTPEATADVCERNVPGIAEGMRAYSMRITPRAMLSRALCMQRGTTLVINLPGSEKAARENWAAVADVLPHAVSMMAGGGHPENEAAAPEAAATPGSSPAAPSTPAITPEASGTTSGASDATPGASATAPEASE